MQLDTPVSVVFSDGATTLLLDSFELTFIDNVKHKIVLARLHGAMRPLLLWRGVEYDLIGDWTQEQAEARIVELLGDNPQAILQSLVAV